MTVSPKQTDFDAYHEYLTVQVNGVTVVNCLSSGASCQSDEYEQGLCLHSQDMTGYFVSNNSQLITLDLSSTGVSLFH